MKTFFRFAIVVLLSGMAWVMRGDTVTLPVAASVVGKAPFVSDVRVFNTSYTETVNVTATYRCTPGSSGCATQPVKTFTLGPRQAKAFDDICVNFFGVPNSLGAVEFTSDSTGLLVTSRLYSPAAVPPWPVGTVGSVGMYIPGLPASAAQALGVVTNLANGNAATGSFRTNIGVYNPQATSVTATINLYDGDSPAFPPVLLGTMAVPLSGQTGVQISDIYGTLKASGVQTTTGYATVESDGSSHVLFSYAATVDNTTQDPVLIVAAADEAAPPGFVASTPTPASTTPNPTPTPTAPTASPTPSTAAHIVNVGASGTTFTDTQTGGSITTIHVGETVKWVWASGPHSSTSGTCQNSLYDSSCTSDGNWDSGINLQGFSFSRTFMTAGTFNYFCQVHQGAMTGQVHVQS